MKLPRLFCQLTDVRSCQRSESSGRRRLVELIYVDVARRRVALEVVDERVEVHVSGAVLFRRDALPQELPQALGAELRVQ